MTTPTREQVVQLLPCPFCGSTDIRNVSAGHAGPSDRFHAGDEIFAVNCYQCGASVPNRYNNDLVVASWNNREGIKMSTKEAWAQAYIIENNKDPHQRFADLLGVSRQEAKVVCYKMIYTIDFLQLVAPLVEYVSDGVDANFPATSLYQPRS